MLENGKLATLNIRDILPNRFQPRIHFDEIKLNELAESIRKYGLIQPIVVRQIGTKYEIIAGERRYKASTLANKETIPAIIVALSDRDSEEIALLENIQREDLTPIEEAVSYKRILDVGYISQEELAKKIGKSQVNIANKIRLLSLDDAVQDALLHGRISERHARSLLKIHNNDKQVEMLNRIINERLTVKMTDREIRNMLASDEVVSGKVIETLSTSEKPQRKAIPVASHRIIKVNPPKELMDKINKKKEERVDTMDIDKILEEAQDITPNEETKPAVDMASLMKQNPNTVTSPVISNEEPIVPVTEPAIEPGKFVTSNVNAETSSSEKIPTSNVSFDSVFNQGLGSVNSGEVNIQQPVNNEVAVGVPLNNTIENITPLDSNNNVGTNPVNSNDVLGSSVGADGGRVSPVAEPVPTMESVQAPAAIPEMPSTMGNVTDMPTNNDMVNESVTVNDNVAMPSMENNTIDSLATEVTPEVAIDNLSNVTWPNPTPSESVNPVDSIATSEVPTLGNSTEVISNVPVSPVGGMAIPEVPTSENPTEVISAASVQSNVMEPATNTQNNMVNPGVMPNNMVTEPASIAEPVQAPAPMSEVSAPAQTPEIPILPGIPGAPVENVNSNINMNIPDDSILEASTPNTAMPVQENNVVDVSANFRQVINLIRNCASEIEKLGFYIDTDEIDLGEKYQVTFKIDKS